MDKYQSYHDMISNNKEHFNIIKENNNSPISVIAIHGGNIEGGTSEIAAYLNKISGYNLFIFEGIKSKKSDNSSNLDLHITSSRFNNIDCLQIVEHGISTISIHGADEDEELTYVGGLNNAHGTFIKNELRKEGFTVPDKIRKGLEGYSKRNVCNINKNNAGVQLELSRGLRKLIFGDKWRFNRTLESQLFLKYVNAIYNGTEKYIKSII